MACSPFLYGLFACALTPNLVARVASCAAAPGGLAQPKTNLAAMVGRGVPESRFFRAWRRRDLVAILAQNGLTFADVQAK